MMTASMNKASQQLLGCMEQVMMEWAFLSLDYLGEPGAKPAKLPLERRVNLECQGGQAVMVLRGSYGLGLELARSVRGLPSSTLQAGEASFSELCTLIAEEWRRREYSERGLEWKNGPAQASAPETWPAARPDGAVVATVRGLAIEVLFWSTQGSGS